MEISIVITNWNGAELLEETLPTVVDAAVRDPDHFYEILLVDDSSRDHSVSLVRERFPEVRIHPTPRNLGYMRANNFGVKQARSPLVFCLNNDVKIEPGTISRLARHFSDPRVFAASGRIFDWEGRFLYGNRGGRFEKGHFSYFEKDEHDTKTQTLFACGGAFLCRKSLYEELGGYDAELFEPYYYDETDLCYRALKKGYAVVYDPESRAFHKVAQTAEKQLPPPRIRVVSARNNYYFSIKNIHDATWTRDMVRYIPAFLIRDAFHGKFRFWKAFREVLRNYSLLRKKRRAEKEKGGIADREIFRRVLEGPPFGQEGESSAKNAKDAR
jgi:GT2 family glycosyltransferase